MAKNSKRVKKPKKLTVDNSAKEVEKPFETVETPLEERILLKGYLNNNIYGKPFVSDHDRGLALLRERTKQ